MILNDWFVVFRRHAAYASAALTAFLVMLEYALPGAVLPYVPLFPIGILSFLLLITMPKTEHEHLARRVVLISICVLIFTTVLLKLGEAGGTSATLLIAAAFILCILAPVVLMKSK